jgi:hypothetical protein
MSDADAARPERLEPDELPHSFDRFLPPPPEPEPEPFHALEAGEIGYALVMVRGDSPQEISRRMGRVAELGAERGAAADALTSGLVVLSFGTLPQRGPGDRGGLIAALLLDLAADMKAVHGAGPGWFGTLGGPTRYAYGFILPHLEHALGRLAAMPFGDTEEYPDGDLE